MEELEIERVERACTRLIHEYAAKLDGGRADTLWELFTDDGVWEMPGRHTFRGRPELRQLAPDLLGDDARITMHLCTNVVVDVVAANTARGHCYFVNHRADFATVEAVQRPSWNTVPRYVGEYSDTFARMNGRWLISRRVIRVNFAVPISHRPAAGQ